jgi:hypothetical protein
MAKRREMSVQEAVEHIEETRLQDEVELMNRGLHAAPGNPEAEIIDDVTGGRRQNLASNMPKKMPDAPSPQEAYVGWKPGAVDPKDYDPLAKKAVPIETLDQPYGLVFIDKLGQLYLLEPGHIRGEYIVRPHWKKP